MSDAKRVAAVSAFTEILGDWWIKHAADERKSGYLQQPLE
jgi:hypothetical protein